MKKFEYITVLRGIAILGVLAIHTYQETAQSTFLPNYLGAFLKNGDKGVTLFYLLSALTLFHSMSIRNKEEKRPFLNFFIRRFFRIAPLYYLAVIFYLWLYGYGARFWLNTAGHVSTLNILSNFTFLHSFSPYYINSIVPGGWSVGIEMLFYCMVPFLFIRIKNAQQALYFMIITFLIRFACFRVLNAFPLIPDHSFWGLYLRFYFPNQLPVFAVGIFLYFIIYDSTFRISGKTILLASVILILGINPPFDDFYYYTFYFVLLILALERYHPKILFNKAMLHIGTVSYSLYLTHFAIIALMRKFGSFDVIPAEFKFPPVVAYFFNYILLLTASAAVSTVTYILIEKPMQKAGSNIIKRLSHKLKQPKAAAEQAVEK